MMAREREVVEGGRVCNAFSVAVWSAVRRSGDVELDVVNIWGSVDTDVEDKEELWKGLTLLLLLLFKG